MSKSGRTLIVNQRYPNASDSNPGTPRAPFKTISHAARLAEPGDTVLVHAGIYRERVAPLRGGTATRPIIYTAAPGEQVIVRGTDILHTRWTRHKRMRHVYRAYLHRHRGLAAYNPFSHRMLGFSDNIKKTLGQVIVDEILLVELNSLEEVEARSGSWIALAGGKELIIHFPHYLPPPDACRIEISTRNRIFAPYTRGLGYIHVKGFTFEYCANQSAASFWTEKGTQGGAVSCRSGHHWVIENNTIRFAKSIGLDCGSEGGADQDGIHIPVEKVGYHLIRNNIISDNGETGICGKGQYKTRVVGNTIERNNALGCGAVEEAGIKFHLFYDGLIAENLVRDNDCHGIWLDCAWYGSRVTRNVVLTNTGSGIFVELGTGHCLVDSNVVAFTRAGDGIYTHDTSGITVAHNLLYCNSHFGVYMRTVTERYHLLPDGSRAPTANTQHQRIFNNVFVDNYRGHICLPLDNERDFDNISDYNLFVCGAQWQWEGAGFNRFALSNDDGRIPKEKFIQAFQSALDAHEVPPAQRPNLNLWVESADLSLEQWRMLTGRDVHSVAPEVHVGEVINGAIQKGSCNFSPTGLFLELKNLPTFTVLRCPRLPYVTIDIFGNKLPSRNVLPGPFQKLEKGPAFLSLWPLPEQND